MTSKASFPVPPVGHPSNILGQGRCSAFSFKGANQTVDGQSVLVQKYEFESAEVTDVREGGEIVVGEV